MKAWKDFGLGVLLTTVCFLSMGTITDPNGSQVSVMTQAEAYEDYKTYTKSVSASASLESILGEALPANVRAVTILNYDAAVTLNYQSDGTAADAADVGISPGVGTTIAGMKKKLDNCRLFAGSSIDVGFIVHTLN